MKEIVFKTSNLCKNYKTGVALDNVDVEIRRGEIYGFVGENGAGKTTLIRVLTGLANKTSGEISLFGKTSEKEIVEQRQRMGCMVESPVFYPNMTARQNLEVRRIASGIADKNRIDEVLKIVKLENIEKKKVKQFSLGMKQKLGIAMALLTEPEFLVLDEPVNGLDPVSIVEMRELLIKLNQEKNITILISSHILSELYQLATCYGFISHGKMIEEITLSQLDEKCKRHIHLKVDDTPKAVNVLETKLMTKNFEVVSDSTIKVYDFLDEVEKVSRELSKNSIVASEISIKGETLENYYIRLIGGCSHA